MDYGERLLRAFQDGYYKGEPHDYYKKENKPTNMKEEFYWTDEDVKNLLKVDMRFYAPEPTFNQDEVAQRIIEGYKRDHPQYKKGWTHEMFEEAIEKSKSQQSPSEEPKPLLQMTAEEWEESALWDKLFVAVVSVIEYGYTERLMKDKFESLKKRFTLKEK